MIKMYSKRNKLPKNIKWIIDIDPYFNGKINAFMLGKKDRNLMKKIENVEIIDDNFGTCRSEEGVFPLTCISTGLKALLIIRYLKQHNIKNVGVDITECGPNVLDFIFEEITDGSIPVLLCHKDVLKLRDRVISLNDKKIVRTMKNLCLELIND